MISHLLVSTYASIKYHIQSKSELRTEMASVGDRNRKRDIKKEKTEQHFSMSKCRRRLLPKKTMILVDLVDVLDLYNSFGFPSGLEH